MEDDVAKGLVRRSERIAATRKMSDDIRESYITRKKGEFDAWFAGWVEQKRVYMIGVHDENEFYMRELPILLDFQKKILPIYRDAELNVLDCASNVRFCPSPENIAKRDAAEEYRKYIHQRIRDLVVAIRNAKRVVSLRVIDSSVMVDVDEEGERGDDNDGILGDILALCNTFNEVCSVKNSPAIDGRVAECGSDIEL
jgi:hypothetical protein